MVGSKEIVNTYYSSLNFKSKPDEYWGKGNRNGLSGHYAQWMILLNIRAIPDEITISAVIKCLKDDYGHLNENCITEAIKANLRGEYGQVIESYQLLNENFLIKLLSAYNAKLLEAHRIAVKIRDASIVKNELTTEEREKKNIQAMKELFEEFKRTSNEDLISSLYYDFFNKRKLVTFNRELKDGFIEKAKEILKNHVMKTESLMDSDRILKEIAGGGKQDEVINVAKKLTIIHYFRTIDKLPI